MIVMKICFATQDSPRACCCLVAQLFILWRGSSSTTAPANATLDLVNIDSTFTCSGNEGAHQTMGFKLRFLTHPRQMIFFLVQASSVFCFGQVSLWLEFRCANLGIRMDCV